MTRPGETTLRLLLAPIAEHLADASVTEVVVNRPGEVGVERRDGWSWHEVPELSFDRLDAIATLCAALSQQDVDPSTRCARPSCQTASACRSAVRLRWPRAP